MNLCSICFEEVGDEDKITIVNCGHAFCKDCIFKLFDRNMLTCPLCRGNIQRYIYKNEIVHVVVRDLEIEPPEVETNEEINDDLGINDTVSHKFLIIQWVLIVLLFVYTLYLGNYNKDLLFKLNISESRLSNCNEKISNTRMVLLNSQDYYNKLYYHYCEVPTYYINQCH